MIMKKNCKLPDLGSQEKSGMGSPQKGSSHSPASAYASQSYRSVPAHCLFFFLPFANADFFFHECAIIFFLCKLCTYNSIFKYI